MRPLILAALLCSLGISQAAAQGWNVDTSAVDPMEDRASIHASLYATGGAPMLLTLSCTIQGFVTVFAEAPQEIIKPAQRSVVPGMTFADVRLRFDKTEPIAGRAMHAISQPGLLAFHTLTESKLITHRTVSSRMQSSRVLWIEYTTLSGLRQSKFDLPSDTRRVVAQIYKACNEAVPTPSR